MDFEIVNEISGIESIAVSNDIRDNTEAVVSGQLSVKEDCCFLTGYRLLPLSFIFR